MQRIEMYHDMIEARVDMERYLASEWRIHTCAMGCHKVGGSYVEDLLVIYEK